MDNPLKKVAAWTALVVVLIGLIAAYAFDVGHTKYPQMKIVEGSARP